MSKDYIVLAINPGSTSTKIAIFNGKHAVFTKTISHSAEEIAQFNKIADQYHFRAELIENLLKEEEIELKSIDVIVGRGGLLRPIPSGTYKVNEKMIEELRQAKYGEHASNLGAIIASDLGKRLGIPSYIVDPVVVDEMEPLARISGMPEIPRKSIFHALNQKAVARKAARELGKKYEEINLIVIHLGGGVSIGAHKKGRVVDVNNALNGDGPFSPERSGSLPAGQLVQMCFSGNYSEKENLKKLKGNGGLNAYLGTADGTEIEKMINSGDKKAELIYNAMAYQIAKEIGSLGAALSGQIDGIILTGGLAYSNILIERISGYIKSIGRIFVYPGENEIEALRDAAIRVLDKKEIPGEYKN
ncbi:butyrate kinase [candidate division KSB1 bacterium]|nr:MAG: butyrate kinase [candidate division KSB1 bacterium]